MAVPSSVRRLRDELNVTRSRKNRYGATSLHTCFYLQLSVLNAGFLPVHFLQLMQNP